MILDTLLVYLKTPVQPSRDADVVCSDLTEKLFDRYLFPDFSSRSSTLIRPKVPIMHGQTRQELYRILTLLCKYDQNYMGMVDCLEDIIPQGLDPLLISFSILNHSDFVSHFRRDILAILVF